MNSSMRLSQVQRVYTRGAGGDGRQELERRAASEGWRLEMAQAVRGTDPCRKRTSLLEGRTKACWSSAEREMD